MKVTLYSFEFNKKSRREFTPFRRGGGGGLKKSVSEKKVLIYRSEIVQWSFFYLFMKLDTQPKKCVTLEVWVRTLRLLPLINFFFIYIISS